MVIEGSDHPQFQNLVTQTMVMTFSDQIIPVS